MHIVWTDLHFIKVYEYTKSMIFTIQVFDPLGQFTVPTDSDNYFRTCFRPSPKYRLKIMIATGGTVGLAEGIIDETCLVSFSFEPERETA